MSDLAMGPSATKEDKNPNGGLSAKGRKKFGVKKGVTNYSSASRADKGRWVSWAMRFTGTPKPVKDSNGKPTRYALMFRAWGEKVPTSVEDVKAVHAKAVTRSKQLKNADKASLEETVDFVETHLVGCSECERVFTDDATLWTHVEVVHLNDPTIPLATQEISMTRKSASAARDQALVNHLIESAKRNQPAGDQAGQAVATCVADGCGRAFRGLTSLQEHAEAVHTFNDMRSLVQEELREKYNKPSTGTTMGTYTWIEDMSVDWVVFSVEAPNDMSLNKSSYVISTDNVVTLSEPVEVVRRTVYDPVKSDD